MWLYHVSFVVITCIFFALWLSFLLGLRVPSYILFSDQMFGHFSSLFSFAHVTLPSSFCLFHFLFFSPFICHLFIFLPWFIFLFLSSQLPFYNIYIMYSSQICEIPETATFTLLPPENSSQAKPCSVPCWDLLQTSIQGMVEFPLPLRHMLFSLCPRPDAGVGSAAWSLPAPIRQDFPRQSLSVPREPDSGGGLSSRWVKQNICGLLAVTVHLELGTEPQLALDIKRGDTVASHTLLHTDDEAGGEIPSTFPLSVYQLLLCNSSIWISCCFSLLLI